jgi:hypothetical protein
MASVSDIAVSRSADGIPVRSNTRMAMADGASSAHTEVVVEIVNTRAAAPLIALHSIPRLLVRVCRLTREGRANSLRPRIFEARDAA